MTPSGLFIGLTTFDLVHYVKRFPRADEKIQALSRWTGAGGPAANAAAAFSSLGGRATLLTGIGDGTLARAAREDLENMGVEVIDLAGGGELATSSAVVDEAGERTVVSLNALGVSQDVMVQRLPSIAPANVISFDSHYPNVVRAVLERLAGSPPPAVFDPGAYKPHVFDLVDTCDHVIASRSLDHDATPDDLLERLLEHDVMLAAVSAGSEPILASFRGRRLELPVPQTNALDTVGAGDVLHGAYAYLIGVGSQVPDALSQAAAIAAKSCEHHGARIETNHELR